MTATTAIDLLLELDRLPVVQKDAFVAELLPQNAVFRP
jgi:hypothetical protein